MALADARKKAGFSQGQLSKETGLNLRMIQYYEQGRSDINGAKLLTLLLICDTLGCGLRDLITDEETLALLEKLNY